MFERFTDQARRVVVLAQEEARLLNHAYIGTEHILLGLLSESEGVSAQALAALGAESTTTRDRVAEIIGMGQTSPPTHLPFTPRAKKILELSLRESLQLGHNYIGDGHILLGMLREGEGVANQILEQEGISSPALRQKVIELLAFNPQTIPEMKPSRPRQFPCRHPDSALQISTIQGMRTVRCGECGTLIGVLPDTEKGEAS